VTEGLGTYMKNLSFNIHNPKCKVYRQVLVLSSNGSWVLSTKI